MSPTIDLSRAVKVTSIPDEYQHLRFHACMCGGSFRPVMQSLVNGDNGTHYDVISAQCMSCKREEIFIFDVSSFFGKHK